MSTSDWHPEDIKCAIRKTRITMVQLALDSGLNRTAINTALRQPWPRVEAIIASRLGRRPQDIWPSRYDERGNPLRGGWTHANHTAPRLSAHRQKRDAA